MKWRIKFSSLADKFIGKNQITNEEIFELIRKAIRYFSGEWVNIDIGKLKGNRKGSIESEEVNSVLLPSLILITQLFFLKKSIGEILFIKRL